MREGTGISLGIGGVAAAFFTALAGVIVAVTYLLVCVYAVVKLIVDPGGQPDPTTLLVGSILVVSALVLGLLAGIRLLGGSLITRMRSDEDDL